MKKTMLSMLAIAVFVASCSKSKNDDPPAPPAPSPVEGYWTGNYTTTGQLGHAKYAMLIKPNGIVRIYDLAVSTDTTQISDLAKATGVWTLTGMQLQTTYPTGGKTVNTIATLNAAYTNMTGTWALGALVKGNITLSK
jgi:hypothetical protein